MSMTPGDHYVEAARLLAGAKAEADYLLTHISDPVTGGLLQNDPLAARANRIEAIAHMAKAHAMLAGVGADLIVRQTISFESRAAADAHRTLVNQILGAL